jgi:hypothetical protein
MASVSTAVAGAVKEYVAKIEFSLNFDERDKTGKQISARIKIGDRIFYDGLIAKFKKVTGEEITGRTTSLGSAIASNWLYLAGTEPKAVDVKVPGGIEPVNHQPPNYDPKRGGDFDEFMKQEFKSAKVIREEDRVVKHTSKMEVSADQVEVKGTTVTSSTSKLSAPKTANRTVTQSEDYGAERSIGFTMKRGSESETKKNAFTVDRTTPTVAEDATITEVKRATVVQADGSQDSRVVGKIGEKITKPKIEPQEGKVVGKTRARQVVEEGIIFNKDQEKKSNSGVTTSSGSVPVTDLSEANTQSDVTAATDSKTNYLELLPADWANLHWVRRERFVMALSDIDFIKFILTVENTKAIQVACKKRLTELLKKA